MQDYDNLPLFDGGTPNRPKLLAQK
jgi:hypothetical protein